MLPNLHGLNRARAAAGIQDAQGEEDITRSIPMKPTMNMQCAMRRKRHARGGAPSAYRVGNGGVIEWEVLG
jgi:hypothetical protein